MTGRRELDVAKEAAAAGGNIVARYFREGIVGRGKSEQARHDLVCDADVEAEKAIVDIIRSHYPDHAILGEEEHQGDTSEKHCWVVDPLDGTNNFLHRVPHFAVSIAYCEEGKPVCGVVHQPITCEWFWAEKGHGALLDGKPIRVDEVETLDQSLVGVGFYYDRGKMMEATLAAVHELFGQGIHGIRRFGTAALDLCMVAAGRYGGFFEYTLNPWDFAAGMLIVQEAGGTVTNCHGDPLELVRSTVLASNGKLHDALLDITRRHHPGEPR